MDYPVSVQNGIEPPPHTSGGAPPLPDAIDRFPVVRLLGRGGMGEVFLARHPVTGVEVAVKRLKPRLVTHPDAVRRFRAEAGHMYHLHHPRVLRVMEVWNPADGPYFVVPYMRSGSLAAKIRPGEALDEAFAVRVALDVAEAVAFAHSRGMIHRDLKPANVLLDDEGRACLSDFGLVGEFRTNDTVADNAAERCEGTIPYMSPAVARGDAEDTRCDIYAFGAMLYEMLTGEPPYGPAVSRARVVAGPPASVLEQNPRAPRHLAAVAEGCMGRELRDRYATMNDVIADLRRVADGFPPVGPHGLTTGGAARRLPLAMVGAVVVFLAVAGGIWFARGRFSAPPAASLVPAERVIAPGASQPREIDLLADLDLAHDIMPRETARRTPEGLELACTPKWFRSNLVFPHLPTGDYDLRIEFTRLRGDDGLDHCLAFQGRSFVWTLAGNHGSCSSFWRVGAEGFGTNENPTTNKRDQFIENGKRYVSELRVRRGSVTSLLNGQTISTYVTSYGAPSFPRANEIPDVWLGRLGLTVLNSVWVIHSARLIEYAPAPPPE